MVDTLVSGASASRRVGSTPISGTKNRNDLGSFLFFCFIPEHVGGYITKEALDFSKAFGGSRGSRTPDPLLVRQML